MIALPSTNNLYVFANIIVNIYFSVAMFSTEDDVVYGGIAIINLIFKFAVAENSVQVYDAGARHVFTAACGEAAVGSGL